MVNLTIRYFLGRHASPKLVTPAQAGAQGNKQDLATEKSRIAATFRMLPWVPACAGMTREKIKNAGW
jgi:hypothetical protein